MEVVGQFIVFCLVLIAQTGLFMLVFFPSWAYVQPAEQPKTLRAYFTYKTISKCAALCCVTDVVLWNFL